MVLGTNALAGGAELRQAWCPLLAAKHPAPSVDESFPLYQGRVDGPHRANNSSLSKLPLCGTCLCCDNSDCHQLHQKARTCQ